MVHENMFNVEKHLNDTIHNPQAQGRSHTEREVRAAGKILGREGPPPKPTDEERLRQRGEALGDGAVLLQQRGLVVRVDTSTLPKDPKRGRPKAPPTVLDGNNRGNMMARIQAAGGTGSHPAANAAAAYLSSKRAGSDEDEPVLVLESDMVFEGGFASLRSAQPLGSQAEALGSAPESAPPSLQMVHAAGDAQSPFSPSPSGSSSSECKADRPARKRKHGADDGERKMDKRKRHQEKEERKQSHRHKKSKKTKDKKEGKKGKRRRHAKYRGS